MELPADKGETLAEFQQETGNALGQGVFDLPLFCLFSAGSKLIDEVKNDLFNKYTTTGYIKPFIHMTFLDAYTPNNDNLSYGALADYAEQYMTLVAWWVLLITI